MTVKKRKKQTTEATTPENHPPFRPVPASVLLFQLFDHRNVRWIASVVLVFLFAVIIFLFPENDRKDVLMFLQKMHVAVTILTITVVILVAVIAIMAVAWYYTRKEDKNEIKRIAGERDKLQKERGCPIQSSEEVQS
jgi:quinol-cytochrome oxidoreductase complex cytochrome b subunit